MRISAKYIPQNTAVGIVDFDNYVEDYSVLNSDSEFNHLINCIIPKVIENNTDYILIRFYGGWYNNGALSRNGSLIQQRISSNRYFPTSKNSKNYHGEIELAKSINVLNNYFFDNTYRIKNGLPNIRLDKQHLNNFCTNSNDTCPARILDKFTKNKERECGTDGCVVINKDAYKHSNQKMVDTMMSLDVVDYGEHPNINKIVLFSDDTDLVPSVIRCKLKDDKINVYATQSSCIDIYKDIENEFNINILID